MRFALTGMRPARRVGDKRKFTDDFMENILQIGAITTSHGVKGEVKVFPMTDDVNRFKKLKTVILQYKNENMELNVESVKFFKNMVILKFKEYSDINDILRFKGCGLFVTRENAVKLKKDEYFIADLIGMDIFDETDKKIGVLKDVIATGANDVYEIDLDDGRPLLLPAIKECVLKVDVDEKIMKIHILEGLLD